MDDYPWANKFIYGCLFMFLKRNFIWAKVHQNMQQDVTLVYCRDLISL